MKKMFYCEITKSDYASEDKGFITVGGIASSNVVDSDGETITTEAMIKARDNYLKFPAIREMHQAIAAGKCTKFEILPNGDTYIEAEIYDSESIKKVKAGVLRAFSIGGRAMKKIGKTITDLFLSEISLVDRPANPNAIMTFFKADMNNFNNKENDMPNEEVVEIITNCGIGGGEHTQTEYIYPIEKTEAVEAIEEAGVIAQDAIIAVAETSIKKGFSDVSECGRIIDNLKYLLMCLTETGYGYIKEENSNEPMDATIPADIKEVLDKLLGVYSKLTVVAVADLQEDIQEALSNNGMAKSDNNLTSPIENAKLDIKDSEILKAGSRNSKKDSELIQKIHDLALELGAMSPNGLTQKTETVDLQKFADEEVKLKSEVADLTKTISELNSKIVELENQPVKANVVKSEVSEISANVFEPVIVNGKIDTVATAIKKSFGNRFQ